MVRARLGRMSERLECWSWAHGYFGDAELGDSRRTARLVRVTARAAETPSGKLSEVFARASELDAAYDFIERDQTSVERLCEAAGSATAKKACKAPEHVFVVVDGSSINVIDGTGRKGVGSVGSQANGGRGLKVISALAVSRAGVPVGVLAQTWWARPPSKGTKYQKKVARKRRKPEEKELRYWLQSIRDSARRLEAAKARGWFQLDREGDAWPLLLELAESGHRFTVRSAWDRVVTATGKDKQRLRAPRRAGPARRLRDRRARQRITKGA